MSRHKKFMERITLAADLPAELPPGVPLVELAGEHRVLIENHCGITAYGCGEIRVKMSYGQLCVCGSGLELAQMTKAQLVITGSINGVSLLKEKYN